ncbi:pyridoxal phosphate-dependent aminotransferase [Paracoccaceae bacterium GXU_MW_L88]
MARLTKLIREMPATVPFVGPEVIERERGRKFRARLGANESGFGPSPKVIEAMRAADAEVWKYPDSGSSELREALAAHHGVEPENIVVGAGIDGLFSTLAALMIDEGTPVVTSEGAYPTFNFSINGRGGALHKVPYVNDMEDPASLVAKAREVDAALVYLANPDNPMGGMHGPDVVARMVNELPEGALLLLDEAYAELAPKDMLPKIDANDPRVIRMRTFSKAYGMAGARVGYAIGAPELIAEFEKVRNHFGMNRSALIGAQAALADQGWLTHIRTEVRSARDRITEIARRNGLNALPSHTNFVAIEVGSPERAKAIITELAARDIFIRMPFAAPQNRCIRVSVGPREELDLFAEALPEVLKATDDLG